MDDRIGYKSTDEITAVGHRVVHGGASFLAVIIDQS
jgi:acetate kinase